MTIAFCAGFAAGILCSVLLLLMVVVLGDDRMESAEKGERERLASWPFRKNNVVQFKRKDEER